jgi:hypothetical protein
MATAKARYTGDGTWTRIKDFSETLKVKLRGYYPNQLAESDPTWGHPADDFVSQVLAEARWAISELHLHQFVITKSEVRAEQSNLFKELSDVHRKLQNLSPDFDRLLGVDADSLGCADAIKELIRHVEAAGQLIDKLPTAKRQAEAEHRVMVEMALRVLRVLKGFGIAPAATAGSYLRMVDIAESNDISDDTSQYVSHAVEILKAIGDDIDLPRSPETWRDAVIEVKRNEPDLQ